MSWWDNLTGKEKAIGAGVVLGLIALVYAMRHKTPAASLSSGPYVLSDVPQGTIPVVGSGGVYTAPVPGPSTPPAPTPGPVTVPPAATPPPVPVPPPFHVNPPTPILATPEPTVGQPAVPVYTGDWRRGTGQFEGLGPYPGWPTPPQVVPPNPNLPPSFFQVPPDMANPNTVPTYTPGPIGIPAVNQPGFNDLATAMAAQSSGGNVPVAVEDLIDVSSGTGGNRFDYMAV